MERKREISQSAGNFNATTRRNQAGLNVHGLMQHPRFQKVVTPCMVQNATPNCKMVLPHPFVRTYLANVEDPQAMVLESFASSWEWQVTYTNESFEDGWQVFSTDYNLENADVITFQLTDKFRFMVQVYSKSGCEKFSCFDEADANMWTFLRHQATGVSEGAAHPEPESAEMMPKKVPLRNLNDRYVAEGLSSSRSRSDSACNSGESQDCMNKRESPSQALTIGGKVDDKLMAGAIEKHRDSRRFDRMLVVAPKSIVATGTDFGRSSNDIAHPYAVRSSPRFKRDNHHVKGKQALHLMRRHTSTSQMLAKAFVERAKRTMNLRVQMKPKSADNVIRTTRELAGNTHGSCNRTFIEQVVAASNSRVSEEKMILSIAGHPVNPCAGGTSTRPDCGMLVEMKPDVTDLRVTKWKSINDTTLNCSKNQPQGTPAKRGRGRPRKCPVHAQPAIKPEVATPGFQRVDRERNPVEEVEKPAQRKRGRPPIHPNSRWRQAGTISTVRQDRIVFVSQRRPVTESEKDDAVAAAYSAAARMQSPCIVLVLKPTSVYKNFALRFPSKFASQRMPRQTRVVRVCDAEWNAWSCWWNPLYRHISGREWRSFALEHCLEEDDACVFEILEDTRTNFTMMVHIFRVANIPAGQTAWDSHICPYNCFPEDSSFPITPIGRQPVVDLELRPPSESPRSLTHQDDDDDDDDDDCDTENDDDYDDDDEDDESRGVKNVDSEAIVKKPVQEKQTKGSPSNFGLSLEDIISDTKTAGLSDQRRRNPQKGIASKTNFYIVKRLCNRMKVRNGDVFLVELDGVVPPLPHMESKNCKPDGNGNWWVHECNFTRDFMYCHIP